MKKLIICHPAHGHMTLTDPKEIETEFNKIIEEGYGDKIPATFYVGKKGVHDSSYDVIEYSPTDKSDITDLINTDDEVLVVGPLAGG